MTNLVSDVAPTSSVKQQTREFPTPRVTTRLTGRNAPPQNDSFVAQDHLVLGCLQDASIVNILKEAGTTPDAIKTAAQQVRGGRQVNSRGAEEGFEALKKYAKDLTAEAEEGKLDPVIGRDSEIRRCIRILSRRTKSEPAGFLPPRADPYPILTTCIADRQPRPDR